MVGFAPPPILCHSRGPTEVPHQAGGRQGLSVAGLQGPVEYVGMGKTRTDTYVTYVYNFIYT